MPSCQKLPSDEESRSRAAAAGRQQGYDSPLYARVRLSPRRAAACTRPSRPPTSTRLRATLARGRNATSGQAHLAPAPPGDLTLSDPEGDATEPLSLDNTLWAGTVLASGEALALVLYTGTDTRGAMNSAPPRSKAGSALALEWWWWWCELSPTRRRSQVASVDLQVNLLAKALPLKHAPTSQPLTRPLCKGALWSHGVDRAGDGRRALHPASRLLAAGERRDVAAAAAGAGATRVPDRTSEARPILLRDERHPQALLDFCRFLLLFSSIIPISLRVALDMAELAPPQRPLAHEPHGERL